MWVTGLTWQGACCTQRVRACELARCAGRRWPVLGPVLAAHACRSMTNQPFAPPPSFPPAANVSVQAREWNVLRADVVLEVVRNRLLPAMEAEARQRLVAAAKDVAADRWGARAARASVCACLHSRPFALSAPGAHKRPARPRTRPTRRPTPCRPAPARASARRYADAFWRLAVAPPLRQLQSDEGGGGDPAGEAHTAAQRIMACCWGAGEHGQSPTVRTRGRGRVWAWCARACMRAMPAPAQCSSCRTVVLCQHAACACVCAGGGGAQ